MLYFYYLYNTYTVQNVHTQSKYKAASKKGMQSGLFTTLSETRDTAHSKQIGKLVSGVRLSQMNKTVIVRINFKWLAVTFVSRVTESVQSQV